MKEDKNNKEDSKTLSFEFSEIEKAQNEDEILKDRKAILDEDIEKNKESLEKEELKEKYEDFKEKQKEDKIENPYKDKIETSIFGMLGITFDNLVLTNMGTTTLNDTEAKNINEAGKLMDAKYKILEKFGVEINYIGMGLMPFLRNDRIEDIKNKRNKKVDINADKHE